MSKGESRLNGYILRQRLREARRRQRLSATVQALYQELIDTCNAAGSGTSWPEVFECSNEDLCRALDITDKTLGNARKILQARGLIHYRPGTSKRAHGTYSFVQDPAGTIGNSPIVQEPTTGNFTTVTHGNFPVVEAGTVGNFPPVEAPTIGNFPIVPPGTMQCTVVATTGNFPGVIPNTSNIKTKTEKKKAAPVSAPLPPVPPKPPVPPVQDATNIPTPEQVLELFLQQGFPQLAEQFYTINSATGWKVGSTPIANWKTWAFGYIKRAQKDTVKAKQAEDEKTRKQQEAAIRKNGAVKTAAEILADRRGQPKPPSHV